MIAFKV